MMAMNDLVAGAAIHMAAPQLTLTVSTGLQTVLRGVAVALIAVLLIVVLASKVKLGGRGGGGRGMGASAIIFTLLVAAMLMDVELFVTLLNWAISLIYEASQWIKDFLSGTGGSGGTGTVNIS